MTVKEYLSQPLRPLPELPVLRDSYCSKETVDRVVGWIQDHHPEWLMKLLREESGIRQANYYIAVRNLWGYLNESAPTEIDGLTPLLGAIDLLYEVSRRLRSAYGFPDVLPQGKPLAPSPNGPFPPMLALKVAEQSEHRGATQEIVDAVLGDFYEQRPDLWFAAGEAVQRNFGIMVAVGEAWTILRKIILKRGFAQDVRNQYVQKGDLSAISSACHYEFHCRIRRMCEIPPNQT